MDMVHLIAKFLKQVIESGGKINVAKSEVMRNKVKYLGFVVSDQGVGMDNKYQQALLNFLAPKSQKPLHTS